MLGRFTSRQAAATAVAESEPVEPIVEAPAFVPPVPEIVTEAPQDSNPGLTTKLLDAKVRLHRARHKLRADLFPETAEVDVRAV